MKHKDIIALGLFLICLMAFSVLFAKPSYNPSEKRVMVIADNDCDATGFYWEIGKEAKEFLAYYGRDSKQQMIVQGKTNAEIKKSVKDFFKNADANDVNVLFIVGHGKEDKVKCGIDTISDKELAAMLNGIDGKTAVFLDCCFGGKLAENILKNIKNNKIGIMTTCYDTEGWTGTADFWWREEINLADRNKDQNLSLAEIDSYSKKDQYFYNRVMYIKAKRSADNASTPGLYGFKAINVATIDESSDISNWKILKKDIKECNELLFKKKGD